MPRPSPTRTWGAAALLVVGLVPAAQGQPAPAPSPASPLTLERALVYAADHAPAIREAVARADAATADVASARATYLPRLDAMWQASRSTANNVFGQLLPQSVIPAMSGPVLPSASSGSVWGSAAGALLSWEAMDFGQRRAGVQVAEASALERTTAHALTAFDVQTTVAAAFLDAVAASEAVAATEADLTRRELLLQVTSTLVENQLRPGAERSRADAERAAARMRVAQAKQAAMLARIALGRVLGLDDAVPDVDATTLIRATPSVPSRGSQGSEHPALLAAAAAVTVALAQEEAIRHADRPKLLLQSALFARGTGANPDGRLDGTGLWFERANWASGVQFVLPNLFDGPSLKARRAAAAARTRAEEARAQQARVAVSSTRRVADAMTDAAVEIASNTPALVDAARLGETQARARYDAGLTGLSEVAEAQSLLASAEYQDAVARVGVWRALLASAAAAGDLSPLLAQVRAAGNGAR